MVEEQQKADEMYDRLIANPSVDPWKLAEYLLKTRELSPEDFKAQAQGQPPQGQGDQSGIMISKMVDLASVENDEMMKGNKIGPTPYAAVVHTQVHIDFMNSERFRKEVPVENDKILQIFSDHVMGEIAAQTARGEQGLSGAMGGVNAGLPGGMTGGPQEAQPMAPQEAQMGNVIPERIEGGGQVPSGMAGANSGVQVGLKV